VLLSALLFRWWGLVELVPLLLLVRFRLVESFPALPPFFCGAYGDFAEKFGRMVF
jgi:hypothetical protein